MMEAASGFIQKHGYSWKAYFIALAAFPPAAMFIALKMPGVSAVTRGIGLVVAIVAPAAVIFGGGALIYNLARQLMA